MFTRSFAAVVALLAASAVIGAPVSTDAAEIGEGVSIQPAAGPNGAYAQVNDDGQVSIQLNSDAAVSGDGLLANANTNFDRVLLVSNTNADDRHAFVFVTTEGPAADATTFYVGTGPDRTSIEGEANATQLSAGESVPLGLVIDTSGDVEGTAMLTIHAEVSEIVDAALEIDPKTPVVDEPVTFDAAESTGDTLVFAYTFGDGTTAVNPSEVTTHTYTEAGTYNTSVRVEETAPRTPNETATAAEQVVVASGTAETAVSGTNATIDSDSIFPFLEITVESTVTEAGSLTATTFATESIPDLADETNPSNPSVAVVDITMPSGQADADATVRFVIDNSVIPAGADASDLIIERYSGTTWSALPTTLVDENPADGTFTLEVETPGFSLFAVTSGPPGASVPPRGGGEPTINNDDGTPTATAEPTIAPPSTPSPTSGPTAAPDPTPSPATTPESMNAPAATEPPATSTPAPTGELGGIQLTPLIILIAVLALLLAVAVARRYRSDGDDGDA